jgi:hypothetical protein
MMRYGVVRRRWENNIVRRVAELGSEDVDWLPLSEVRAEWLTFMNIMVTFLVA